MSETPEPPSTTAEASMARSSAHQRSVRGSTNQNPPDMGLWALWREDLRTHDGNLFEQGFWAVAVHRFGNWRMNIGNKWLRAPLTLIYRFAYKWVEVTCGISLPYVTKLGRRVRIWHHGGMVLHARAIGDEVQIRQNTTFGVVRVDDLEGLPIIGDRVDIGCNACVLGGVSVGQDAVVGAGAVVLHDVPPGGVAVGVPAKVIKQRKLLEQEPRA